MDQSRRLIFLASGDLVAASAPAVGVWFEGEAYPDELYDAIDCYLQSHLVSERVLQNTVDGYEFLLVVCQDRKKLFFAVRCSTDALGTSATTGGKQLVARSFACLAADSNFCFTRFPSAEHREVDQTVPDETVRVIYERYLLLD